MKIVLLLASLFLLSIIPMFAQQEVIPLYDGPPPGTESWDWPETELPSNDGIRRLANITQPTLTVYQPEQGKANGTGLIVAPGGGFRILAINHEGEDVATWLAARGVTVFVLKYRVMRTSDQSEQTREGMLRRRKEATGLGTADGIQAVRVARKYAGRFGVSPDRIGILGFSAGGWVAATTALEGRGEGRPDFAAPIYAVIPETVAAPANPMPLFLLHADNDNVVPPLKNSVRLYELWKQAEASAELHIYSKGGHGFGMKPKGLPTDHWIERFWTGSWQKNSSLRHRGLLHKSDSDGIDAHTEPPDSRRG